MRAFRFQYSPLFLQLFVSGQESKWENTKEKDLEIERLRKEKEETDNPIGSFEFKGKMINYDKMEENIMIEIRFHGRGGQGAVTAAEILAKAAFEAEGMLGHS